MTRRDFELIAETIRMSDVARPSRIVIANEFATALQRTNPRFDTARFIMAATKPTSTDRGF